MSEWLPISKLFNFEKGTLQSSKCTAGNFTFITASADWKTHNAYSHETEALVFAMAASGSLGRTHYVNDKFIASDLCFILTPKTDKKIDLAFYFRVFNFIREDIVKKTATGTSKLAINQSNFGNYKLPYFDFEHQVLFREKIDKISAIKNGLSNGFSNQQTYLTQLREAILQEAIEGELTADWRVKNPVQKGNPDHDAQALLETIKTEKQKLITEGKIKKEKPLAPINPDDVPFALPNGWVWVKTNDICDFITKGTTPAQHEITADGEIPFLKVYNIVNQKINFSRSQFINSSVHEKFSRSKVFAGDVLMNIVGPPLGKIALVPNDYPEWNINQAIAKFRPLQKSINKFLYLYLLTGISIKEIPTLGVVGQDNISLEQCRNMLFPLPPLAEQNTIVERVDRLLESVNALELQVTERKKYAQLLLQAVLTEAFEE